MTKLGRNIRSVAKHGNNISAVVLTITGNVASVRLSTNGAIYRTLKVVGGPVHVGQIVQVDMSSDIPYIAAIGTATEIETFDYKKRITKNPPYIRPPVTAGAGYSIILYEMSTETLYYFTVDADGLNGALAGATPGDTVFIPPNTIDGDFTIPEGVVVIGLDRNNSIINGTVTMSDASGLQNLTVTVTSGSDCSAIRGPAHEDEFCDLFLITSFAYTSSGSAAGLEVRGGDVDIRYCEISGSSGDGNGFGIAVYGEPTAHYAEGDEENPLYSFELPTNPSVFDVYGEVYNPEIPITMQGGPGAYCEIIDSAGDNSWVSYDLGATYWIHKLNSYSKPIGDHYKKSSLNGGDWWVSGLERVSWTVGEWYYGEILGQQQDYYARYIRFEEDAFPLIGDRILLGYFAIEGHVNWTTWEYGIPRVYWSDIQGSTYDLYGGNSQIQVYADQYDQGKTEGTLIYLDGDVRWWQAIDFTGSNITDIENRSHTDLQDIGTNSHDDIDDFIDHHTHPESDITDIVVGATKIQSRNVSDVAPSDGQVLVWDNVGEEWVPGNVSGTSGSDGSFTIVDVSAQIPAVDDHYDLVTPIYGNMLILYKNGIRQEPGQYTIDGDGLGFTTAFSCVSGDKLVVDYNASIAALPQYTVLFSQGYNLVTGVSKFRIYNPSNRIRYIKRIFLSVNTAPSTADLVVDIHMDGVTIFTNQANRPKILISAYSGYVNYADITLWEPDSYLEMYVDVTGNAAYLVVHVVYE